MAAKLNLIWPAAVFFAVLALGSLLPALSSVLDLAMPFFGIIGLGYFCGKLLSIPEAGLQWMSFFAIFIALPALFFNLVSQTPFAELSNIAFIAATTLSTYIIYTLSFAIGLMATRGDMRAAAIQALGGAYSNIGSMGPALTLGTLGAGAAAPTALIFMFDNILFFSLTPLMMAAGGDSEAGLLRTAGQILRRIALSPFFIAVFLGIAAAYFQLHPPAAIQKMLAFLQNAAAPSALFIMGVTVALRPVTRVAPEIPALLLLKLVGHPLLVWLLLSLMGDFGRVWTFTAVLMAALPPGLNVFVLAKQYGVYVERSSSLVLFGTMASVLTVTAFLYLIAQGIAPYNLFAR